MKEHLVSPPCLPAPRKGVVGRDPKVHLCLLSRFLPRLHTPPG